MTVLTVKLTKFANQKKTSLVKTLYLAVICKKLPEFQGGPKTLHTAQHNQ